LDYEPSSKYHQFLSMTNRHMHTKSASFFVKPCMSRCVIIFFIAESLKCSIKGRQADVKGE
jgi:hypothetical protein